jgi:hypothetical protein
MKFMVYRHAFAVPDLRDGETYLLDIGSATATPLSRDNKVVTIRDRIARIFGLRPDR